MTKYAAFLRGVNVGGRIIKMSDLKIQFEKLGFTEVKTLLNSGNVIFQSPKTDVLSIRKAIEADLSKKYSYSAVVFIYPINKLGPIVDKYPFDRSNEGFQHYVLFFDNGLEKELAKEASGLDKKIESVSVGDSVLYWKVKKGMTVKSAFSKHLLRAKYKEFNTNRNIKTLSKVLGIK